MLNFFGVKIPEEYDSSYWTIAFRNWLRGQHFKEITANTVLYSVLDELEYIEKQKKGLEKALVKLSIEKYSKPLQSVRKVAGIRLLGAMTLILEIGDIKRFRNNDQLHSFCGLIPNLYASGETERVGRITKRHNKFIRPVLIQCEWKAIKLDPVLAKKYSELCTHMKSNRAIIRIAKKLLNRVKYAWINNNYEIKYL